MSIVFVRECDTVRAMLNKYSKIISSILLLIAISVIGQSHVVSAATVTSNLPASLYIPKISKNIPVIPVGVTFTNVLDVPHNFVQAGWYKAGPLPGEIGSAVLDGHVDNGATVPGVFKNLYTLTVGDDIYITQKSGNILHFKVIATTILKRTASSAAIFANSGVPLLKIITCFGTFVPKDKTYDQRLVVTALLLG